MRIGVLGCRHRCWGGGFRVAWPSRGPGRERDRLLSEGAAGGSMAPALSRGARGARRPLTCPRSAAPRPRRLGTHGGSWPQWGHGAQERRARTAAVPESSRRLEPVTLSEPGASRDYPPRSAPPCPTTRPATVTALPPPPPRGGGWRPFAPTHSPIPPGRGCRRSPISESPLE